MLRHGVNQMMYSIVCCPSQDPCMYSMISARCIPFRICALGHRYFGLGPDEAQVICTAHFVKSSSLLICSYDIISCWSVWILIQSPQVSCWRWATSSVSSGSGVAMMMMRDTSVRQGGARFWLTVFSVEVLL